MSEFTTGFNIPLPGAAPESKRLIDIQSVKTAIVTIDGIFTNVTSDINTVAGNVTALQTSTVASLATKVDASTVGQPNGVATLNVEGQIPATQLPSFVDDILEYNNLASFPLPGETGKIYVAKDTNKTYRWSGSIYIYITSGAVDMVAGKIGVVSLVKGDVGLANVDNTSDAAKPVSTAQAAALANKTDIGHFHIPADVGLGNVDNTSDLNKPVSTATQTALNAKVNNSSLGVANGVATLNANGVIPTNQLPSFVDDVLEYNTQASFPATGETGKIYVDVSTNKTYRWSGTVYVYITSGAVDSVNSKTGVVTLVKADIGLGDVDNTSDANKPVSTAQATAINAAQAAAIAASTPIAHVGSGGTAHSTATGSVAGFMSAADKSKLDGITGTTYEAPLSFSGGLARNINSITVVYGTSINTVCQGNDPRLSDSRPANGGAASTAATLQSARLINGVAFDGSANITINAVDATARIPASEKGVANGVATLNSTGVIPSNQLPSFVDDVLEFANLASLPATGETGKIYVALDTNKTYRWSGSAYIYITSGAVDSVAGKTGVVTLVKGDVGLANVDNVSDVNKPVSTAQQTAINASQAASTPIAHVGSGGTAHANAVAAGAAGFMTGADKAKLDSISGTNTGDETTGTILTKLGISSISGVNTGDQTNITGNSGTATKLATPRNINGVAFDGTGNITINAVDATARIASSEKGVANGIATLDATGVIPVGQVPNISGVTGLATALPSVEGTATVGTSTKAAREDHVHPSAVGGPAFNDTISTIAINTTAVTNVIYVLTATLDLELPASPQIGWRVTGRQFKVAGSRMLRNGSLIEGDADNLDLDQYSSGCTLTFVGGIIGWLITG